VYTDVWTSMGQEAEREHRLHAFVGVTVDDAVRKAAAPDAVFLHCLPAHRGEEVATEVIDGPRSLVWQQAANRMHAARALLVDLMGGPSERREAGIPPSRERGPSGPAAKPPRAGGA